MLVRLGAKGVLARFQKAEFASGVVAIPTSPIPPARASGEILKKGTDVVTTLIVLPDCDLPLIDRKRARKKAKDPLSIVSFIPTECLNYLNVKIEENSKPRKHTDHL